MVSPFIWTLCDAFNVSNLENAVKSLSAGGLNNANEDLPFATRKPTSLMQKAHEVKLRHYAEVISRMSLLCMNSAMLWLAQASGKAQITIFE